MRMPDNTLPCGFFETQFRWKAWLLCLNACAISRPSTVLGSCLGRPSAAYFARLECQLYSLSQTAQPAHTKADFPMDLRAVGHRPDFFMTPSVSQCSIHHDVPWQQIHCEGGETSTGWGLRTKFIFATMMLAKTLCPSGPLFSRH